MNVYDFDGTIYNGDSTIDFWKFCLKRHPKAMLAIFPAMTGLGLHLFGIISKTKCKQRFYSFLKYIPDVDSELAVFWGRHEIKIQDWYLAQKRSDDLIISASPTFLLEPICCKLGVKVIASKVEKHTGIHIGDNCHGDEKVKQLQAEFPGVILDDFYSDSLSDSPLAKMASNAFWVDGNIIVPWSERKTGTISKFKHTFLTSQFFLFVFCGGCGTLVNFFFSLTFSRHIDSTLAYVGGYAISLFVTYALNTYLIFKNPFSILRFVKFAISYIPNFLILLTFVAVLLNILHLPEIFVYLAAAVLGLPITFIIVKFFAFGSKVKGGKQSG